MLKGSLQQQDISLSNFYEPNIGAPKYIKKIFTGIKGETNSVTIIIQDFNSLLTSLKRSSRHKINNDFKWDINPHAVNKYLQNTQNSKQTFLFYFMGTWYIFQDE